MGKFQDENCPNSITIQNRNSTEINWNFSDKVEPDELIQCSLKALSVLLEAPQTTGTGNEAFTTANMNSCTTSETETLYENCCLPGHDETCIQRPANSIVMWE
jgi:hypothetical protein